MDRGRRSSRNVPRQRSLLQRDWPGLRLHVPAQLPPARRYHFCCLKKAWKSKLEQQRKRRLGEVYKTAESRSPLFVNFYALGFTCLTQPCSHDEPSCFSQGSLPRRLGAKSSQSFFQEPPDKRMTRIGMGGPKTRAIFEEVL